MLPEYYNTFIATLCHMTDVTDEEILDNAVAEVTRVDDDEDGMSDEGYRALEKKGVSLFDKAFVDDPQMAVGYIRLPIPIVNVNYMYGSKPVLPALLKRSRDDLEKLIYFGAILITKSGNPECVPVGTILEKNPKNDKMRWDAHAKAKTGGEAILYLLEQAGIENTGIVHEIFPVPPLDMRTYHFYCKNAGSEAYRSRPLDDTIRRLLIRSNRVRYIMNLGAPEIIQSNEMRILQEYADTAINNGARKGYIEMNHSGMPYFSLRNEYCCITKDKAQYVDKVDFTNLPKDRILETADNILTTDMYGFDEIANGGDGTYQDESGNIRNMFEEDGPEHTKEKAEERYRIYTADLTELKDMIGPAILKYLENRYPAFGDYYEVVVKKIYDSLETWLEDCNEYKEDTDDFFRDLGYRISAVSYQFLANGVTFYEDDETEDETKEPKKENAAEGDTEEEAEA